MQAVYIGIYCTRYDLRKPMDLLENTAQICFHLPRFFSKIMHVMNMAEGAPHLNTSSFPLEGHVCLPG